MKKVKVGVIGCGVMGNFHLKQYQNIPEVEIIGASDIDPSRSIEGRRFFNDYKELLKLADAVSITTPTSTHFKIGMDALNSGCHVLIEKPISVTGEEALKLIKTAKAKRSVLAVGHIERFNPAYTALKKGLGRAKPDIIDIKRLSPFPERINDVSCVIDMMIHDIDLAIDMAGSEVKHMNAIGKKTRSSKLDQAIAVLVFKNGMIANIEASRVHSEKMRRVVAMNGKYIYEADLLNKKLFKSISGKRGEIKVTLLDQLNSELRAFISAISKRSNLLVTGEDGLNALAIANRIEEEALMSC